MISRIERKKSTKVKKIDDTFREQMEKALSHQSKSDSEEANTLELPLEKKATPRKSIFRSLLSGGKTER